MSFFSRPLRTLTVRNALLPTALGIWAASIALAPALEQKLILLAPVMGGAAILWTLSQPKSWMYLFFLALRLYRRAIDEHRFRCHILGASDCGGKSHQSFAFCTRSICLSLHTRNGRT